MSPRLFRPFLALVCAVVGPACAKHGYLKVTVQQSGFAHQLVRFSVTALDYGSGGDGGVPIDAGPSLVPPEGPVAGGIDPQASFLVTAGLDDEVAVIVAGLGADGGVLARGATLGTNPATAAGTSVTVSLSAACDSARDCDPHGVCQGQLQCSPVGSCQAVPGAPQLVPDGSVCGPSPLGHCDGLGNCLLPYCGLGVPDGGQLPVGEQCDNGLDGGNSDTLPDHCRIDCTLPRCGDGVVDPDAGEVCDLGTLNGTGVGCNATCTLHGQVTTLAGKLNFDAGVTDGGTVEVDGPVSRATFLAPAALAVVDGGLWVADKTLKSLRRLDLATKIVATIAGGNSNCFDLDGRRADDGGIFCDLYDLLPFGEGVLVADDTSLRQVTPDGYVSTFDGVPVSTGNPNTMLVLGTFEMASLDIARGIAQVGQVIYSDTWLGHAILANDTIADEVTMACNLTDSAFTEPLLGLAAVGDLVYFGESGQGQLLACNPATGNVTVASPTEFNAGTNYGGLCSDGASIFICASDDGKVLQFEPRTGAITLLAGGAVTEADGVGSSAGFLNPAGCTWDPLNKVLYVADAASGAIRMIR